MKDAANAAETIIGTLQRIIERSAIAVIALCLIALAASEVFSFITLGDIKSAVDEHKLTVATVAEVKAGLEAHRAVMGETIVGIARRDADFLAALVAMDRDVDKILINTVNNLARFNAWMIDSSKRDGEFSTVLRQIATRQRAIREQLNLLMYTGAGASRVPVTLPGEGVQ